MIIKVKKYVAKVARYVENPDGTITKETEEIVLSGKRFSKAGVWKQIPRDAKLLEHGYVEKTYDVDPDKLLKWCEENGKPVNE